MNIALTGSTGFVGSHILTELVGHGHEVTAVVRDEAQADVVRARGATPTVVDLYDLPALVKVLTDLDGAVHTASPGDATSADLDSAVVAAAIDAYGTSGKPFVQIGGLWIYGNDTDITEGSPVDAPALVAWKEPLQRRLLSQTGMRGVVVVSGTAYGDGGGDVPGPSRLAPRRRGQLDHAGFGGAALGHSPRCRSG